MKAKRDNIISELIAFRITQAKAKKIPAGGGEVELNSSYIGCHAKILIGINNQGEIKGTN